MFRGEDAEKTDDSIHNHFATDRSRVVSPPYRPSAMPVNAFTRAGLAHLIRGTVYTRLSRRGFDYFNDPKWGESVEKVGCAARRRCTLGAECR